MSVLGVVGVIGAVVVVFRLLIEELELERDGSGALGGGGVGAVGGEAEGEVGLGVGEIHGGDRMRNRWS